LALAAWARLSSIPKVFVEGEILPQGGDSAYHLRRTLLTAADWPRVPVHDPLMNWPDGGPCHWAPGLDLLAATAIRALGLDPSSTAASTLAMLVPVALGLLVVAACWELARRLVPDGPGSTFVPVAAAVVVALLPQAEATGRVGRLDHHVAEVLCMTLLGVWVLAAARPRAEPRPWAWEVAGAATLLGGLVFFAGSVLYAAIATVMMGVVIVLRSRAGEPGNLVGSGAPAFVLAALGCALVYGEPVDATFSYVFPSRLQPVLLLTAAAALGLARLLLEATSRRRAIGGVLALFAVLAMVPAVGHEVMAGLVGWLGRQDPWLASIHEFQPMLLGGPLDPAAWGEVRRLLALPGLLGVILIPLGLREAIRLDRRLGGLFAGWTLVMLALTLWQLRFGRLFTVNLAVCTALALWGLSSRVGDRRSSVAALLLLALIGASPNLRKPLTIPPVRSLAPLEEAAVAMRLRGPVVPGTGAGVFVPWDMGHFVLQIAHRPVVATGFGTYLDEAGFSETAAAPRGTEAQLVSWMERRDLGYVIAGGATLLRVRDSRGRGPLMAGADGLGRLDPETLRELPLGNLLVGGSGVPGVVPHLERLRPVFASTATIGRAAMPLPVLWTYELVEGRVLRGSGPPGATVGVRLDLEVRGAVLPWMATGTVGDDGAWTIRVPLEPGADYGSVRTAARYLVQVGARSPAPYVEPG
jgi:asparagine N-glycosylation enzyme membrane subunit Stt3